MGLMGKKKETKPIIPVVELKGVIAPGERKGLGGSHTINIDQLKGVLTKAFNTSGAVAVALDINSPGGSPTQSELVGNKIRELAEEKNIPVYAFAQDVAASGGYWIACAADEIFAAKTSTIGSIGVVNSSMGYAELAKKLGIEDRTATAGHAKRRMSPLRKVTEEDQKWLQSRLDKMHVLFKDYISERRGEKLVIPDGMDKDTYLDQQIFTGETWFGQEAVDLGLIDGVGYIDDVLKSKFGSDVKISPVKPSMPGIFSLFSMKAREEVAEVHQKDISAGMVADAFEVLENEAHWGHFDMR